MASWEPGEIDFEDAYDKADPIDDVNLEVLIDTRTGRVRR